LLEIFISVHIILILFSVKLLVV